MATKRESKRVSKAEDKKLRDYELVLIISPEVDGKNFDTVVDKVGQFITDKGGVVSEVEKWGERKLAYPIRHFMEGNYVLSRLKLMPALCKELEASLLISEDVLRHLLIKLGS